METGHSLSWWRAHLTVLEMLKKRNFEHVESSFETVQGFLSAVATADRPLLVATASRQRRRECDGENNDNDDLCVYFVPHEARISIKTVRVVMDSNCEANTRVILVSCGGSTPLVKRECDGCIEVFSLTALAHDITSHRLVPRHTLYNGPLPCAKENLPHLPTSDAVARFLDFRVGDVVKVDRASRGGGLPGATFYRLVVPP